LSQVAGVADDTPDGVVGVVFRKVWPEDGAMREVRGSGEKVFYGTEWDVVYDESA
jgi:hypothetical protein